MIGFVNKKKHFKRRLSEVQTAIWELEFQKFKLKEIREGFRIEFDKIHEARNVKQFFRNLVEKYGLELGVAIHNAGAEVAQFAFREGEESNLQEKLKREIKTKKLEELDDKEKEIISNLERQIKPMDDDIAQLKKQMDDLDKEINQTNDKISGVISLHKMVKEFIKKL